MAGQAGGPQRMEDGRSFIARHPLVGSTLLLAMLGVPGILILWAIGVPWILILPIMVLITLHGGYVAFRVLKHPDDPGKVVSATVRMNWIAANGYQGPDPSKSRVSAPTGKTADSLGALNADDPGRTEPKSPPAVITGRDDNDILRR